MDDDIEIVVGTYEDYVVGYSLERFNKKDVGNVRKKLKKSDKPIKISSNGALEQSQHTSLEQSFAVRVHSGSVRSLAASSNGSLVFSAGLDEVINLFSLKRRKLLQTSECSVTCANFVGSSHIICGSDDNNVYIYECKSSKLKLVKTLRGHSASIIALDAHKSGKVLLSLSRDKTMRTWNLIKGRCAYVTNIGFEANLIKWAKDNDGFLIAGEGNIYLYNSLGSMIQKITLERRVNSLEFIGTNMFVAATDSGRLDFFLSDDKGAKQLLKFEAHKTRIKSVKCLKSSRSQSIDDEKSSVEVSDKEEFLIATASSDGLVKVWSVDKRRESLDEPRELAEVDVGARVTCMITSNRSGSN